MSGIAITFPSSPSEGQSYLAQNGFTYIYDSQKNRWKRGGEFVRAPKVLTIAGTAVTTTGSGITTGPTGTLIYEVPGFLIPSSEVGIDSFKAYRTTNSYPNHTEIQVSISSAFSSVAYAATFTGTTHTIASGALSGNTTYYLRARQFVGSDAAAAGVGAISGYSQNIVSFATTSTFIDTPTIVSISGSTDFPVYQIGYASTTLPATVTYTGSGVGNLDQVDWRVTGPRIPTSTGDTALAEIGIGTHSSSTLANALVLALPFSGATGVGITDDVNNAIRTASGASAGTTKTLTANGNAGIATIAGLALTSHFYDGAAYFDGNGTTGVTATYTSDFDCSGDFTSECWVYGTQLGSYNPILCQWSSDATGTDAWTLETVGTALRVYDSNSTYIEDPQSFVLNKWQHLAVVYRNGILNLYRNGTLVASATKTISASTLNYTIGRFHNTESSGRTWYGYIQDVKHYKGLAKYTENFTPPLPTYGTISYTTGITNVGVDTTAFYQSTGDVGIAETSSTAANALVLAMPMNKTFGFQDINVSIRGLTSGASAGTAKTVGLGTTSTANAPTHPIISATESKWYDGAAYFDGNDYGTIPDNTDLQLNGVDWTIEMWINPNGDYSNYNTIIAKRVSGTEWELFLNIGTGVLSYYNGTQYNSTVTPPAKVWSHIAAVNQSGTIKLYLNGLLIASFVAATNSGTNQVTIGTWGTEYYKGYIQDLKIYKGLAKYTADFTPPQPICGFSTDISTQTGFTTTTASGALLSSVVGLGSTSTLAFDAGTTYAGITSITSSSGITTLTDPYAQNLVLALPLANITGAGTSFTNDRNTQIRSVSLVGGGSTKTVTNSGVTTSTAVTKYYDSSAYFGGSPNYTSISSFSIGENVEDFTFETWVYTNDTVWMLYAGDTSGALGIGYNIDNSNQGLGVWSISVTPNTTSGVQISYNKWTHIAVCRKGGIISFYVDGEHRYSASNVVNYPTNSTAYIGRDRGTNSSFYYTGYLQDLKIYKGLAKYTTNFTPPPPMFGDYVRSTPNKVVFTPGSDYVLEAKNTSGEFASSYSATRQWGTKPEGGIYDPYAGNLVLAITGNNTTTQYDVSGQIRLETPTSSYSSGQTVTSPSGSTYTNKSVTNPGSSNVTFITTQSKYYGYSMYFAGTGNLSTYLSIADSSDFDFQNDWTIECWFYMTRAIGTQESLCASASDYKRPGMFRLTNGKMGYFVSSNGSSWDILIGDGAATGQGTITVPSGQWNHVAFQRRGTTYTGYINGVIDLNKTVAGTPFNAAEAYTIGRWGQTYGYQGYIQDFRIYTTAKYTSNFTPPNQIYLT